MFPGNTDKAWEYFGENDPYYGVIISDENRIEQFSPEARIKFFDSGFQYIELIMKLIRDHLDLSFQPHRALDFGCGVGRLVIPISKYCNSVIGVDISASMIEEAKKNCIEHGISNASFIKSDDSLSGISGKFDFINSFIVFQHISPNRGLFIFQNLIDRLQDNGIGVLHFTYFSKETLWRKTLIAAYKSIPFLWGIHNLLKRKPITDPMIQMNAYDLNQILRILQEKGCHHFYMRFTDHEMYGVIILFQKKPLLIL